LNIYPQFTTLLLTKIKIMITDQTNDKSAEATMCLKIVAQTKESLGMKYKRLEGYPNV